MARLCFLMNMNSIQLISQFLKDRVGVEPEQVTESALLADLGVDSLMLAELMFEAEDRFGISINIEPDQPMPQTVAEMIKIIDGLLAAKASVA